MVYKLAEEDKLCGVIYPTYEGFKPIPKATCEMLESKCDKIVVEVNCKGQTEEEAIDKVLGDTPLENLPTIEIGITTGNTVKLAEESSVEDFKKVNKALLEGKLGKGYTVDITVDEPNKVGEQYTEETVHIEVTTPSGKKIKKESLQKFIAQLVLEPTSESTSAESVSTSESTASTSESTSDSTSTSKSDSTSSSESTSTSEGNSVSESTSVSESVSVSESTSTSESVSESTTTSVSTSESESSSNTGSETHTPEEENPDVERDNLTTDLRGLNKKINLGTLSVDYFDGYFNKAEDFQIYTLDTEVNKIRKQYPDYTIEYTLQYPEEEPKTNVRGVIYEDKNKYLVKFTITRGNKSTEVPVYMPFTSVYTDHL